MPYEYTSRDPLTIKVSGGSRAGLLSALAQGLFAAVFPEPDLSAPTAERAFELQADDFNALTTELFDAALASATTHKEAYEGLRFTLLTETKATGMFLGRPSSREPKAHKAVPGFRVERNPEGLWEAEIVFSV